MRKRHKKSIAFILAMVFVVSSIINVSAIKTFAQEDDSVNSSSGFEQMIEQAIEEQASEQATETPEEFVAEISEENDAQQTQALTEDEIADRIYEAVNKASELAFMDETQVAELIAFIAEIEEQAAALPQTQSVELQKELESLKNAKAAAYTMQEALQAYKEGRLDELEQTGVENSWRYQNGQRVDISEPEMLADLPDGVSTFTAGKYWGIDVSHHQSTINWEQVRDAGIDFAIIRCGYGGDYSDQDDRQWQRNVAECERLGIPYGVYLYSYALDESMAYSEAQHTLRLLKGHTPDLPVFLDMEDNIQAPVGNVMLGKIAKVYCDTIQAAGYEVGIYASYGWWTYYLTDPVFENDSWYRWVAQWGPSCSYKKRYEMWQYTKTGTIAGIAGHVDMDYWYGEFPGVPDKDGLAQVPGSSEWAYYKNGHVDHTYTGLAQNQNGAWWYVKDGYVRFDYTGLVNYNGVWWYVEKGEVNFTYIGLVQYENVWYYVSQGVVDWNYTDLIVYNDTWWYVQKGVADLNYNGVVQNGAGWWYVKNGQIKFDYTGLAYYNGVWWYVGNNKLDFGYVGLVQYENVWYYISQGVVDWNYTDLIVYNDTWWYVQKGVADLNYNGVVQNGAGWWYVKNGQIKFDYTGLAYYNGVWWYVGNNKLDFGYNGIVLHENELWYIRLGVVDYQYKGLAKYSNNLWYVNGGKVDKTFTGTVVVNGVQHNVVNGLVKI